MENRENKVLKNSRNSRARLRKQVRIFAVIASLSVIITFVTILVSVGICLHYKKQYNEVEAFAEQAA